MSAAFRSIAPGAAASLGSSPAQSPTSAKCKLGGYRCSGGKRRELVVLAGAAGSRLLVDRAARNGGDQRLVAHIAPDEPPGNERLLAQIYLADPRGRWCRRLSDEDLRCPPTETSHHHAELTDGGCELLDAPGEAFALATIARPDHGVPELRWTRLRKRPGAGSEVVSLRRVVGSMESYEPARGMTAAAVSKHRFDPGRSVATLGCELERMAASPIILNRLLRSAVQQAVADGMSMSLIAMRCGRVKRDTRGNLSGETSWLGRRLGMLPEGGGSRPTPWIHSDVLALIAIRGLGKSPREVELA